MITDEDKHKILSIYFSELTSSQAQNLKNLINITEKYIIEKEKHLESEILATLKHHFNVKENT